ALVALALVVLAGLARSRRVVAALAVVPGRADVRAALAPERRLQAAAGLVAAALQVTFDVVVLWVAVEAVGATVSVPTLALAWLVAVTLGALSPAGAGAGLVEGVLAVLLWRWG